MIPINFISLYTYFKLEWLFALTLVKYRFLDTNRGFRDVGLLGAGEDVDTIVVEIVETAAEIVPQTEEDLAEITQSAHEEAVMDIELIETAGQLQSAQKHYHQHNYNHHLLLYILTMMIASFHLYIYKLN